MAKFGTLNTINQIAQGDALKWDQAMKLENSTVLVFHQMEAQRAWIESRMYETD